jgi:hypothetical protein
MIELNLLLELLLSNLRIARYIIVDSGVFLILLLSFLLIVNNIILIVKR